jgi:hypothetical protein
MSTTRLPGVLDTASTANASHACCVDASIWDFTW